MPLPLDRIRIVLVETSHPGNIGAAARAMKTMGLGRLVLVRPRHFPDAEASARAAGADDLLAQAQQCASLAEAVADCTLVVGASARRRTISWPELDPRACAARAVETTATGEVALVFGRERSGLSNAELDLCHALVCIPANAAYGSLNLAAAVQVIAYEVFRAAQARPARPAPLPEFPPATSAQLEGFLAHLQQTLEDMAYLDPVRARSLLRRLRRLYLRAGLDANEINILRGILSATQALVRPPPQRRD